MTTIIYGGIKTMKRCKKDCKSCDMCTIKTASGDNNIYYCFECIKYGVYGDNTKELYNNVQWELNNK
jgi:hypothetical protein